MGKINFGSLILGLLVGIALYHFTKNKVGAGA
jgi:hypothetical protein